MTLCISGLLCCVFLSNHMEGECVMLNWVVGSVLRTNDVGVGDVEKGETVRESTGASCFA